MVTVSPCSENRLQSIIPNWFFGLFPKSPQHEKSNPWSSNTIRINHCQPYLKTTEATDYKCEAKNQKYYCKNFSYRR